MHNLIAGSSRAGSLIQLATEDNISLIVQGGGKILPLAYTAAAELQKKPADFV